MVDDRAKAMTVNLVEFRHEGSGTSHAAPRGSTVAGAAREPC